MEELDKRAKDYVHSLDDFDIKQCGDFEIEDMEKSYKDGYVQGLCDKRADRECDIIYLENENAELKAKMKSLHDYVYQNEKDAGAVASHDCATWYAMRCYLESHFDDFFKE